MRPLVIVGAGGFGREVAFLVEEINAAAASEQSWDLQGFVDDDEALLGGRVQGLPVLGPVKWLARQSDLHYVIAVGMPSTRRQLAGHLADAPLQPATLVHPSVPVHRTTRLGEGTIVCRGTTLTVAVTTGPHVILNLHGTVGHDAILGAFVTAHPGVHLSGNASIADGVELGTGAVVLPGVTVGEKATLGAGAVAPQDLPPACTAVGVPARPV